MKHLKRWPVSLVDLSAVAFVLLCTWAFTVWILGGSALVSNPDVTDIFLPMAFDSSRLARDHGILAMGFNPYLLAGYSNWLNANFSPFYPFFFNWLGSDVSGADTLFRLEWVVRLHLLILAVGGYWLARQVGVRRWTAACCACVLPWLPGIQTTLGWTHIIASIAWIPWILAAQLRIVRATRFDALAVMALAVCSILLIYAQPAQNLVLTLVASLLLWCVVAVRWFRMSGEECLHPRPIFLCLLIAGVLVLAICGYYLLSLWKFQGQSIRWLGAFGHVIGNQRVPIEALKEFSVGPRAMLSAISYKAEYSGNPGNLFVGLPLLLFAAYAAFQVRDVAVRALAWTGGLAFALTCTVVVSVSYWIPLINKIREVTWWSCLWLVVIVPVAARGVDVIIERWRQQTGWPKREVLIGIALLAAGLVVVFMLDRSIANTTIVLAALLCGALLVMGVPGRLGQISAVSVAPLLALVSIVPMANVFPRSTVADSYYFSGSHIFFRQEAARLVAEIAPADRRNFRAAVDISVDNYKLITHALANHDMRMIRGDIHPQLYSKFQLLYFPTPAVMRLFGVRYLAKTRPGTGAGPLHWETIDGARPRLYFRPFKPTPVANPIDALQAEAGAQVKADYVSGNFRMPADLKDLPSQGEQVIPVQLQRNDVTEVRAVVTTPSAGILVLNEDPAGDWQAHLNHQTPKPFAVNEFQTGFVVPVAGTYEVVIRGGGGR